MNVLSVFDGMSCGRVALERAGIHVDNYFASEIDKYTIAVSEVNYPDIIRLGDIRTIDLNQIVTLPIDLYIGGSPCQSLSFAGKMKGMSTKDNIEITTLEQYVELKQNGFEFQGQSYLFWEYIRILKHLQIRNPNVKFLLENVCMLKKWKDVISNALGVTPHRINSNKYSAQNRKRLYWTNIENVKDKETDDLGLLLSDVLLDEGNFSYPSEKRMKLIEEAKFKQSSKIYGDDEKCGALCAAMGMGGGTVPLVFTYPTDVRIKYIEKKALQGRTRGVIEDADIKASCLVASMYKNMSNHTLYSRKEGYGEVESLISDGDSLFVQEGTKKGYAEIENGECFDYSYPKSSTRRGRKMKDKAHCLLANSRGFMKWKDNKIRFLHPIEAERLQTLPDGYTDCVSTSQRLKMIGNGWTVDTIAYIFKNLK